MPTINLFTDAPTGIGQFTYIAPAAGDPGSGNYTLATGTSLEISDTSSSGKDVGALIDTLVAGDHIDLYANGESRTYSVSLNVDNTTYHTLTVAVVSSSTSFALTTSVLYAAQLAGGGGVHNLAGDEHTPTTLALFNPKIADRDLVADAATIDALAGAAGATPFGSWTFDTGTSGDPGAGGFRITHPTATGSTTELYVSATDAVGIVHVLDDIWATDSQLYINQGVEAMTCVVTSITDETGWYTVAVNTVVVSADTSWTDTADFLILASAGAAGGGDVSATGSPSDEEIAVWTDGTTIEGRTGTSVTALLAAATTTAAGIVELATDGEDAADKVVQGNDARLDAFTTSQDGLVPQSGASTALYLKGDGTWADPSAGSGHGTTNSIDDHGDVDIVTDAVSEGEVLVWRTDEFVPEPQSGGGGSGDKTLASNATADLDATEIVVGGAYIDGSTGGTYSWEMLGTYNDNGGTGNQDIELRLYDRGPDGTPVAGVLRSVIEITSLDTLDRVTQSLTASGSPGVDADEIFNTARMYEVRAYIDAAGAVDTAKILSCVFIET